MTRLHDELARIADHTPDVDLTETVLRRARRRRATALSAASALAVTLILAISATVIGAPGPGEGGQAATSAQEVLPASGVAPLAYAYYDWCGEPPTDGLMARTAGRDCLQWRVVTRSGDDYRVPEAMSVNIRGLTGSYVLVPAPVAITGDGRKIAYYSEQHERFAVRDLESGQVRLAPPTMPVADIVEHGAEITLSDDGRFLALGAPRAVGTLVDVETGERTTVPASWSVRSIGAGGRAVVTENPDHLGLFADGGVRPFTGAAWHTPGRSSPDGATIAHLTRPAGDENPTPGDYELITRDAATGEVRTTTRFKDAPADFLPMRLGPWLSATEITVAVNLPPGEPVPGWRTYAADVTTGAIRPLDTYSVSAPLGGVVLPGF
ncbi:hypothetical protein [Herbidospora sp. RD11066]